MCFLLMTKLEFSLAGVVHGLFSTLFDFHFKNRVRAGGQPREHSWLPNEEGYATTDMESDQLHVPASFLCYGTWLTQEPPCRFQTTCVQFSRFARFSQSDFPMSIEDERAASERFGPSSKDIERFHSHNFSFLVLQPLLSGLIEAFLHVRCIPHE